MAINMLKNIQYVVKDKIISSFYLSIQFVI